MNLPWRSVRQALTAVLALGLCGGTALLPASGQEKTVSNNFNGTPLQSALETLFAGTGLQYSVDPNVPNVPITLQVRDITLQSALRLVVRQAAVVVPGLTSSCEGEVFLIKIRQQAPPQAVSDDPLPEEVAASQELTWEKIPIQYNSVLVIVAALGGKVLPTEAEVMLNGSGRQMMRQMMGGMGGFGSNSGGMGGGLAGSSGAGTSGFGGSGFGSNLSGGGFGSGSGFGSRF